jgi:hypothetical protein
MRARGSRPIDHRAIPENRQIEAVAVERNELRPELADLLDEVAYEFGLGPLTYMRRAERIHAPALRLTTRDQGTDAEDLVQRVLGKAVAERLANIGLGGVAHVEHPRRCRKVWHSLQVPNDDGLLWHNLRSLS